MLLNGLIEIIAGGMLAFGILSRWVGLLLGIHLFIIAVSMGLTAIGVRDIGLALATLSLFFLAKDEVSTGNYFSR